MLQNFQEMEAKIIATFSIHPQVSPPSTVFLLGRGKSEVANFFYNTQVDVPNLVPIWITHLYFNEMRLVWASRMRTKPNMCLKEIEPHVQNMIIILNP